MKKFIIIFCLTFSLLLCACNISDNTVDNNVNTTPPSIEQDGENDDLDEEKKKKTYLISKTNSLRIRSAPNSSSKIFGYLDKNDALIINGEKNGYYVTIYKESTAYVSKSLCDTMTISLSDDVSERAIDVGSSLLGYPYVWGSQRYHWGNGKLNANFVQGQFDCSALVQYAYYKADKILLDVTSRAQSKNGVHVEKNELKRGDLMFFTNESRKNKVGTEKIGHVGVYFGNNYILHTASDHAVIEPISTLRWSYYLFSRRVV